MSHLVIFIGCPGVGKSTLINCLEQTVMFDSGTSYEKSREDQIQKKEHKGTIYVEVSIKNDAEWINAAAKRVQNLMEKRKSYQIFFVVKTKTRKIRKKDLNVMQSMLENAKSITSYNVIINKLSNRMHEEFCKKKDLKQLFPNGTEMQSKSPLLLLHEEFLFDAQNKFKKLENLEEFIESTGMESDNRGNNMSISI